jgi:phage terminase large subunit GpA-like protein
MNASELLAQRAAIVLPPPPTLTVSQWADEYRILSAEASGEPGRFRTDRAPYQRGMMDALGDPRVETVAIMTSAQIGKTEALVNNTVGYFIHQDPSPIMVVQPTIQAAEKWSKTRLAPMLRDTPALRGRVKDAKSRDSGNTITEKAFPGGLLVIVGSNAPAGLASQPIRVVICDEVDRFEESAGTEGDPVDLAFKRTTTFTGRRKHVLISTPGVKGSSRIEKAWLESDQRRYFVPCPHCGEFQTLDFARVTWPDGQPELAILACVACGSVITDAQKQGMLRAGEWRPTRPFTGTAGFHLNELYSPWRRFGEVARDFVKAKHRGPESLKVWINTSLGEPWDPRDGEALQADGLMARREAWTTGSVPAGVGLLVASVDVQSEPQRLEVQVTGFGAGEEAWLVEHVVIPGNLAQLDAWDRLEAVLTKDWDGLKIRAAAVDIGGHFTKQVYQFARRPRLRGLVFPVKGATTPQQRLARRSGTKARLWLVDTVAAKDTLAARLQIADGPGCIHFPQDLGRDYFEQMLAERPVRKAGRRAWEKVQADARNEALDLWVYTLAALEIFAPKDLDALVAKGAEARTSRPGGEVFPQVDEPVAQTQAQPQPENITQDRPVTQKRIIRVGSSSGGRLW